MTDRVCQSCNGTGYEAVSPETRCRAASELASYIAPKLKAIEHSGPGGDAIPHKVTVALVKTGIIEHG
jgi:hypothetical protein